MELAFKSEISNLEQFFKHLFYIGELVVRFVDSYVNTKLISIVYRNGGFLVETSEV